MSADDAPRLLLAATSRAACNALVLRSVKLGHWQLCQAACASIYLRLCTEIDTKQYATTAASDCTSTANLAVSDVAISAVIYCEVGPGIQEGRADCRA